MVPFLTNIYPHTILHGKIGETGDTIYSSTVPTIPQPRLIKGPSVLPNFRWNVACESFYKSWSVVWIYRKISYHVTVVQTVITLKKHKKLKMIQKGNNNIAVAIILLL